MGSGDARPGPARFRRWFGWTRDTPVVAVAVEDDVASVLCLRRRAVITAFGRVTLPSGTVRDGRFRVTGPAIEALRLLRDHLDLPDRCLAVFLVQPNSACSARAVITAQVEGDELAKRRQVADAAGFVAVRFEPMPAALARLGRTVDGPVYAEGGGWRTYADGDHLEVERSDRTIPGAVLGPSPVDRAPLTGPDPIQVDPAVHLLDGWPLLLGAALSDGEDPPLGRIEETGSNPVGGWTIERVGASEGADDER